MYEYEYGMRMSTAVHILTAELWCFPTLVLVSVSSYSDLAQATVQLMLSWLRGCRVLRFELKVH